MPKNSMFTPNTIFPVEFAEESICLGTVWQNGDNNAQGDLAISAFNTKHIAFQLIHTLATNNYHTINYLVIGK